MVVHAGDWVDAATLDLLEARSRRLVAVYGNNDGPELRARLPEVARTEIGGLRFAVVHETGQAAGRERRCEALFPDADVLVFGHSHIPWDTTAPGGLRLLNPGSPTDRRRQPDATYMRATVTDRRLARRTGAAAPLSAVATRGYSAGARKPSTTSARTAGSSSAARAASSTSSSSASAATMAPTVSSPSQAPTKATRAVPA